MSIVRSSPLRLSEANPGKLDNLHEFLSEYRDAVQRIVDHVWESGLNMNGKVLDIPNGKLYIPSFVPVSCLPPLDTRLSGRAVKCASTQAMSMLKAALKRRSKDLAWLSKLDGKSVPAKLKSRLARPLTKPSACGISAELTSICADLSWTDKTSFDGWLNLTSLGKSFGRIQIPVKRHRHLNKLSKGRQLKGLLVSETRVDVRFSWEPSSPKKQATRVVGGRYRSEDRSHAVRRTNHSG